MEQFKLEVQYFMNNSNVGGEMLGYDLNEWILKD